MKRDVIIIDENKCNGCGLCIPNCPEGALRVIDGKARLLSDLFCDGLGACMGYCPQEAIKIQRREALPYNEKIVMENIIKGGRNVIKEHLKHLKDHGENDYVEQAIRILKKKGIPVPDFEVKEHELCGCPGSKTIDLRPEVRKAQPQSGAALVSELRQWPIEMHLVNPQAAYFKNADLVVAADCVPFAYPDFHRTFLKNKALIIFCPKLDNSVEAYVSKLAELIEYNGLKSITIVHMEVPCCFGTRSIVTQAMVKAKKDVLVNEFNISIKGKILSE